ncbi:alpha/beta fold hydrolase [Evansella tamaricis]|uniref:Lysophospholipase n=1 Tax=Evansella tamaricis TaxID=2069301 RepID=A0ABS6JMS1_9BACI|nr:alpha/beta fold hydrolase [Evansella tamaricis]MBU9714828.1 lysophospholipase [Evansella tamaricis]
MEKVCKWIDNIKDSDLCLREVNPHYHNKDLQSYLSYYRFATEKIDEYRCGLLKVNSKNLFIQFFLKDYSKATIFLVHGYLDHSGGLSRTINFLLENDYQVVVLDLPGHGFSEGEEGVISNFKDYLVAVEEGYRNIHEFISVSLLYGFGHSTGGALLFHAASENKIQLNGIILVAPLFYPYRWNLIKGFLLFIGKYIPRKKRSFKKNSNDRVYRNFIKHDPLQVKVLQSAWVRAMNEWQADFTDCPNLDHPVYFIQGTKDKTVDWQKNIAFYRNKCSKFQVALFQRGRHQLLNERVEIRELVHRQVVSLLNSWSNASKEPKK